MNLSDICNEFTELLDAIEGNHLTKGDCNSAKIALKDLKKIIVLLKTI